MGSCFPLPMVYALRKKLENLAKRIEITPASDLPAVLSEIRHLIESDEWLAEEWRKRVHLLPRLAADQDLCERICQGNLRVAFDKMHVVALQELDRFMRNTHRLTVGEQRKYGSKVCTELLAFLGAQPKVKYRNGIFFYRGKEYLPQRHPQFLTVCDAFYSIRPRTGGVELEQVLRRARELLPKKKGIEDEQIRQWIKDLNRWARGSRVGLGDLLTIEKGFVVRLK